MRPYRIRSWQVVVAFLVIGSAVWAIGLAVYDPTPPPDVPTFASGEAITLVKEWAVWCDSKVPSWSEKHGACTDAMMLAEREHEWTSAYSGEGTWVVVLGDYRWKVYESYGGVVAKKVPYGCHYTW